MTDQELYRLVNNYIGVSHGYLGDFTYRTLREFYPQYCDLDINPNRLDGTTRERFIHFLRNNPPDTQAKIIRGVLEKYPVESSPDRIQGLFDQFLAVAGRLEETAAVSSPDPTITSAVVERAIEDADILIRERGATSGVDRVHTSLHGYLLAVCDDLGIEYPSDPSLNRLLRILQENHPSLVDIGTRSSDVLRVLRTMGAIMDALNPLRNQASVAHPNRELLDQDEAMLVINSARTILNYLNAKFSP